MQNQYQPKHPQIQAEEITFTATGVRKFLVSEAGQPVGVIDASVFERLYAPSSASAKQNGQQKSAAKQTMKRVKTASKKPATTTRNKSEQHDPRSPTFTSLVRQALAETPRTAYEVKDRVNALGANVDQSKVSTTLAQLRIAGQVRKEESSGQWHLVAAKAAAGGSR